MKFKDFAEMLSIVFSTKRVGLNSGIENIYSNSLNHHVLLFFAISNVYSLTLKNDWNKKKVVDFC